MNTEFTTTLVAGARKLIEDAQTIAISGHTSPDGDSLGSALGLGLAIQSKFPEKQVSVLLADDAACPRIYRFLPYSEHLTYASRYEGDPDLFICVDAPSPARIANSQLVLERAKKVMVIDHHPSDVVFGDVTLRNTNAAAASAIIARLLERLYPGIINPKIATCLYTGLVTDTGRFQYQNATPDAFAVAMLLVNRGANPSQVALHVYQSKRIEYMHLESIVLGNITVCDKGAIAYSFCTSEDLKSCGVKKDECDGLIDLVRSVAGAKICMFLREDKPGVIRGNLRAKDHHNVADVARELGGGGHAAAAGFTFEGSLDEAFNKTLPMLEALLA